MKNRVVLFFKDYSLRVLIFLFVACSLLSSSICGSIMLSRNINNTMAFPSVIDILKNFFESPFRQSDDKNLAEEYVYLGGFPVGITIENDGVVVIAKGSVTTKDGEVITTTNSDIQVGDIITSINNIKVSSTFDIADILSNFNTEEKLLNITLIRDNKMVNTTITPALDVLSNKYRLGLWVRDTATGVGTMTFIKENGEFSALGHPISDVDTSSKIDVKNGDIYKCNIISVQKGSVGSPGELRGLFIKNSQSIGTINKNTNFGLKGNMSPDQMEKLKLKKYQVGRKGSVKPGKAKIVSTIDGVSPQEFDVEIVKTALQTWPESKSMIIHVTDKSLIEKTGGIVQGMSGSPIIQDGKIVGAVTHVFVNDPTRGYGLYMDWMID